MTTQSLESRSLLGSRAVLGAQLATFALAVAVPCVALAYPGQEMVEWARGAILAPLCLFAIIGSILVALVQPRFMIAAVWTLVISFFLFFVIANGSTIIGHLQNSG
jgi:hypothetical protein